MKIDRLIAITMYLLNRETVSAPALAERFEVSKRTIQRDMETLNQAGIPIISTYGTDGGYFIMDGFKLAKRPIGTDDYINIAAALEGMLSAYDSKKVSMTLEKVLAASQGEERRIFVDFGIARESAAVNEYLPLIEKAVNEETPLLIEYVNAECFSTKRIIEPLVLGFMWYSWYLFAYCTEKLDYRLFKLPRISKCEVTGGIFTNKHGDIGELIKKALASDKRKVFNIRLLCKKEIRQQAIEYLHGEITEEHDNGDFIMTMTAPFERMWFSLLLGFGNKIKILEPEEIINIVKQKAEEILALY